MDPDREFLEYRRNPGRETLLALLRSRQEFVYRVCLHVLRHPQDAEDAAQDVLLEITREADRLRDLRQFRHWLGRVALHTALDHRKRRARRARREEAKAAMKNNAHDESVAAVHDALARLSDEDRALILEKYFEGATLETLAARSGVSTVTVWRRLALAIDRLKQRLAQAGLAAVIPGLESILESIPAYVRGPGSCLVIRRPQVRDRYRRRSRRECKDRSPRARRRRGPAPDAGRRRRRDAIRA